MAGIIKFLEAQFVDLSVSQRLSLANDFTLLSPVDILDLLAEAIKGEEEELISKIKFYAEEKGSYYFSTMITRSRFTQRAYAGESMSDYFELYKPYGINVFHILTRDKAEGDMNIAKMYKVWKGMNKTDIEVCDEMYRYTGEKYTIEELESLAKTTQAGKVLVVVLILGALIWGFMNYS